MNAEHSSKIGLARLILGLSVTVALIASFFLSWNLPGLQIPITVASVVVSIVILTQQAGRKLSPFQISLLATAMLASAFIAIRSSEALMAFNVLLTLFVMGVLALELSWQRPLKLMDYIVTTWLVPWISFPAMDTFLKNLQLKFTKSLTYTQKSIVRGALFALPLLLIFGALFASADIVFANIFKQLFSFDLSLSSELFGRTFFALIIFTVLTPILSHMFLKDREKSSADEAAPQSKYAIELSVVLGSLNLLFLLFVFIQGVYLFGSSDFVLNGDITYAEYGRRGFFELLAVSVLVFGLAFGAKRIYDLKSNSLPKILLLILITQVGFIIVSALRRLGLYEEVFGFTELRFYSHSFIFFLIAAFGLLVYAIQANKPEATLLRLLVVTFSGYIILLNVVNPDATIAQKNLDRFEETGKVDSSYFASLSEDAIGQKTALFTQPQPDGPEHTGWRNRLCKDKIRLESQAYKESWTTWHASRRHAADTLSDLECS